MLWWASCGATRNGEPAEVAVSLQDDGRTGVELTVTVTGRPQRDFAVDIAKMTARQFLDLYDGVLLIPRDVIERMADKESSSVPE